jgi:hypothetical protein
LLKIDGAGTFLVLLELKIHTFPPPCDRHGRIRFEFFVGVTHPLCFIACNLLLINESGI